MRSDENGNDGTPSARRAFLQTGLYASAAAALSACGWDGGERAQPVFGAVAHLNDWVSARLFSPSGHAQQFPVGKRSKSFPDYHISAMTPTVARPEDWRLSVKGLVKLPLELSVQDIMTLGKLTYTVEHHCVEGWSAIATWTGLPLKVIAYAAGVKPEAKYVRFDSFDEGYYNGWDIASAMHPETILAYAFNDRQLMPDHGAPLRLYAPHNLGYKLTKYLTTITFTSERPGGYWEDQGYPWFGGV